MAGTVPFDDSDPPADSRSPAEPTDEVEQAARDLFDHLQEYAQEHPGHVALFCLGVGFYLGWKLKP